MNLGVFMKGGVREDRAHLRSHISWRKRIVSECVRAWGGSGVTLAILGSRIIRECIQLTLLGNNSIMSGTAPSELCHGLPGEVRENRGRLEHAVIEADPCQERMRAVRDESLPPVATDERLRATR